MVKTLSSEFKINAAGNAAVYSLTDETTKEVREFTVDPTALIANPAAFMQAAWNGIRIRCREATGGKAFADAIALLDDFIAQINAGAYPKRQREAGEARTSPFIRAVAAVFYGADVELAKASGDAAAIAAAQSASLAAAQAAYEGAVAEAAKLKGVDLDAEGEAAEKASKEIKLSVRKMMLANKRLALMLEQFKQDALKEAADRQATKLAQARAALAAEESAAPTAQ